MAPIEDGLAAPAGMLLISKDGEQERIIYPVHADGWRRLGWTIHTPAPLADEDEEPPLLAADGGEILPDGLLADRDGVGAGAIENTVNSKESQDAPLDVERMTKPQIVAAVRERFGVDLDLSQTRAELLATVEQLMAADQAVGDGEPEAQSKPLADDLGEGQDEVEDLVPSLLI
ncbi:MULTISPECIES: hypothetical protein [unclassified Cyanobium]|uniref:hypothetical protein n=1 Tax=unclassified Cyanobium TaxID=2627006 RepID=UPI0020CE58E8|nr:MULTISPECIES: hypothetical protein [unclassified Cyanobium]MCP9860975.1 hypothetical protein [Cyanobium sp. Cruz-8H5]MCP9868197.1 hypothetical protein [Cyanobium sp. Cruz-8D1]